MASDLSYHYTLTFSFFRENGVILNFCPFTLNALDTHLIEIITVTIEFKVIINHIFIGVYKLFANLDLSLWLRMR